MGDTTRGNAYRAFEHAAWERAAAHYSGTFAAATALFVAPLLDAARCESGCILLDVACGPGLVASAAAARGAVVTGVDFSAAMVAEARRRTPAISFERADAEALPFPDNSFDALVCGFGVHHFPFPVRAIAEAHRVLKPGGRLGFTVWASEEHAPQRLLVESVRAHGSGGVSLPTSPHGDINNADACALLLREAGFSDDRIRVSKVRAVLEVGSMSDLIVMMQKGTARSAALLQAQPAAAMAAIRAALEQAAAKYKRGGIYALPAAAVLATGRKA